MTSRGEGLGAAIRAWRERLPPAAAGFSAGYRRRAVGLRREELADLAGVSVEYLVRLEQGRSTAPSPQVAAALARALQLTTAERDHLYRLANLLPPPTDVISDQIPPGLRRVVSRLADAAVAVFAADWQMVWWNRQWAGAIGDPASLPPESRNFARNTFPVGPPAGSGPGSATPTSHQQPADPPARSGPRTTTPTSHQQPADPPARSGPRTTTPTSHQRPTDPPAGSEPRTTTSASHRWDAPAMSSWPVVYDNVDITAASIVSDLRRATGRFPREERLTTLISDLIEGNEQFAALWAAGAVGAHRSDGKVIHHPELGPIAVDCDVLTDGETELKVVILTAAPGSEDESKLRLATMLPDAEPASRADAALR
ncbi:helix-turn-helix domain-containing protein [Actinoplanes sp. NPDC049265]|uniref:helix-turn-helix domain-containing protein n=1 Tax=Actinoplanes sp. NPDC049265 TaxID=3363902 RepID=UPI00371043DD